MGVYKGTVRQGNNGSDMSDDSFQSQVSGVLEAHDKESAACILVVDDMPTTLNMLTGVLSEQGYRVTGAKGGRQALSLVRDQSFDLVLLDLLMPDVDGREVLRIIRRTYSDSELPIVVVTAKNDTHEVVDALNLGANDYITKPIDFPVLFARIRAVLSHKRTEDDLRQTKAELERRVEQRTAQLRRLNEGLKREIEQRKRTERRYRALYDHNPSMFFTLDAQGTILSVNEYGAAHLGYSVKELVHKPTAVLFHEDDRASVIEKLRACIDNPNAVRRRESCVLRKDGSELWVRETYRVVNDVHGNPNVLVVCEDITEAHRLSERLSYQASHDDLTGLVNRREFEKRLSRILETAKKSASEHALCYLDLDQFKVINDTCGHIAGDELLHQLGELLQTRVRKRDTLARLGGDEFGVLMEHCSLEQAGRLADALREAIENFRFDWEGQQFSIGVSIGLVPITQSSNSITEVLGAADAACYEAKDAGRNRIKEYRQEDTGMMRRHGKMLWVVRIDRALEEDRFQLDYQPIVPVQRKGRQGQHYELLLRMLDQDGGLVAPGNFLPTAEHFNQSVKLDRWVIKAAFAWLSKQRAHLDRLSLCSINLSGQSLADERFHEFVIRQFDKTHIPPSKICFEVTETAAIANLTRATRLMSFLKELGCSFALDDFGSGLSSFGYLRSLPVDYLKIDGAFVKDIVTDPINLAMVRSINEIGHQMGKRTIAEFVENEAVLDELRNIEVDYVQGYFFGRPQPIDQVLIERARLPAAQH